MKAPILYKLIVLISITLAFFTCSQLEKDILNSAPDVPSDPTPADSASLSNVDIELSWICLDPDSDPVTYEIYLDTIDTPEITDSLIDTTTYTPARLFYNTTYYWQVVASDSLGNEAVSPIWRFTITDDVTSPTINLNSPNGGEVWHLDSTYNITWTAIDDDSIAAYRIEYSDNDGSSWANIQDWTAGNPGTYAWTLPDSTPSTNCLVRVSCADFAANDSNDASDSSFYAWPAGGMIAFASDRSGSMDVYTMNAVDGSNLVNLTNNSTSTDYVPTWSPDCSKIAFVSLRDGNQEIYVMNNDGTEQVNLTNNSGNDSWPSWSPNGDKIIFSSYRTGNWEVYIMDIDGSNQFNLTNSVTTVEACSEWSSDASEITFHSDQDGNYNIFTMNSDGTNRTRITTHSLTDAYPDWSHDGLLIAFSSTRNGGINYDIFIMNVDGSNVINISNNPSHVDYLAKWSPDGLRLVFMSDRTGDWEVFTMNSDGSNPQNLSNSATSVDYYPCWSPIY